MKRLIAVLSGLLVLPAFAEVAPVYYDEIIEYADTEMSGDEFVADDDSNGVSAPVSSPVSAPKATKRTNTTATNRAAAARTVPATAGAASSGRTTTSRTVSSRNMTGTANPARTATAARTAAARNMATRNAVSNTDTTTTAKGGVNSAVRARAGVSGGTAARASIVQSDTVNTPLYTGRVGVRTSTSSVSSRVPTVRASSASVSASTAASTTTATTVSDMDELAQLTDFCKAQYTQCMDNYCNVLDDNQGRCTCSKNIKNYEKTENALKQATQELQDVAQKIQYIGLSADEVTSLFEQTEAEAAMQNKTDNTQLKNDLDKIKSLIFDVKSGTASATDLSSGTDLSGLLENLSFGSASFDFSSVLGTSTGNTSSINNQRGETLYKTATARCKASVLNSCSNQGVDISVITNSYDLEIDKHCVAYERALNDSNDQMTSTVRNAKNLLQKARLLVAREKNRYDMRSCINALDSCMQDDFVCGSDYENCLDPTGKYIVNGAVVVGGKPGIPGGEYGSDGKLVADQGLYKAWEYDTDKKNAWSTASTGGNLHSFISAYASDTYPIKSTNAGNMANYIKQKIGYIDDSGRVQGLCASVLSKCQLYTFDKNGKYKPDNEVVNGYLERVLVQIKSVQDDVLTDYAESCMADVSACLSKNNYGTTDTSTVVARQACQGLITTCRSTISRSNDATSEEAWLREAFNISVAIDYACTSSGGTWTGSSSTCTCPNDYALNSTTHRCEKKTEASK